MTSQTTAQLLDGTATARALRAEIGEQVRALKAQHGVTPHLAVIDL